MTFIGLQGMTYPIDEGETLITGGRYWVRHLNKTLAGCFLALYVAGVMYLSPNLKRSFIFGYQPKRVLHVYRIGK
jgi:hypothetical protein